jgi:glycosyltransferase involved in cell wall biosynthesis
MDWIIFGDDWGAHPSTTQHLVRGLPTGDRVVWVNSIGMRGPRLTDARSIVGRVARRRRSARRAPPPDHVRVVSPRVAPLHATRAARAFNRASLTRAITRARRGFTRGAVTVLSANPAAAPYLPDDARRVAYLRLDDYARLPGVDPGLVRWSEPAMVESADVVFGTAERLLFHNVGARQIYLPQGVDVAHFSAAPLEPPARRVLGFFGLLAEWIDYDLILAAARAAPEWTLELVGPTRGAVPAEVHTCENIKLLGPAPYDQLPARIAHWRAAWIPFRVNALTEAVNPVKLREYLAAGLPTLSTPLPEVSRAFPECATATDGEDVARWLRGDVAADTSARRAARRESVADQSWAARAAKMRDALR